MFILRADVSWRQMFPRLREAVRHLAREARDALRIAPVEVTLTIAVAVFFSVSIESENSALKEEWGKFALAAFLVWLATFVFTTLQARKPRCQVAVVSDGGGARRRGALLEPRAAAGP